jgi:uncharacterized integral membrane protein
MQPRQFVGAAILLLLAVFIGYNWTQASVRFFAFKLEMPLGFLVLFAAGLGSLATVLLQYVAKKRKPKPPEALERGR